jgi:hypothetical protein
MCRIIQLCIGASVALTCAVVEAELVSFFDPFQVATPVAQGTTSDTIRSHGYLFTYTRDKLFTGGGSVPIGRQVRIPWPEGVEGQAVTAGPNPSKAKITIERADGDVFAFRAFTAELLANTFGAGGKFEVVPFLDGEEVWNDPLEFEATGFAGLSFSYDTSPNLGGSTALLTGFDKYSIDLYVDFALTALTFEGAAIFAPPGDYNEDFAVDAADYTVWRNHLGESIALPNEGPGVTQGEVTEEDFSFWKMYYGDAAGSGAAAAVNAPEPATAGLSTLAIVFVGTRRRRGRLSRAQAQLRARC